MADSYASLNAQLGSSEQMFGKNGSGEHVIINRGEHVIYTETIQRNGWMRINAYHEGGTVEELFER